MALESYQEQRVDTLKKEIVLDGIHLQTFLNFLVNGIVQDWEEPYNLSDLKNQRVRGTFSLESKKKKESMKESQRNEAQILYMYQNNFLTSKPYMQGQYQGNSGKDKITELRFELPLYFNKDAV